MGKITVDICGGLGNQLFQIFTAMNLAKKYNMEFVVVNRYFLIQPPNTEKRHTYYRLFFNLNYIENIDNFIKITEPGFEYSDIVLNSNNSYCLSGFYQSWKYLQNFNPLSYLKLPKSDQNRLNDLYTTLKSNKRTMISIHIRRGDYLNLSHFHTVLPLSYYESAIKMIDSPNNLYLIFSDDLEWCKKHIKLQNQYYVTETDYVELFLMSLCDHNIIANSSFSWWGAYLNSNPNKKVIYPSKWFQVGINTKDLFPTNWIKCEI